MIFDERTVVASVERLNLRELRLWVRQGWVRPADSSAGPVFDDLDVARIELLCDLRKEMSLPNDALPVVLNLIDRLHQTRRELRALAEALEEQPKDVRRSVVSRLRNSRGVTDRADEDSQG
jgi:chaperone modulatory protein CbpM